MGIKYTNWIRSSGTFIAQRSGNWNDRTTWKIEGEDGELYDVPYYPESGNPVETGGFSISLSHDAECLSIDNIADILPNDYQLTINGEDQFINAIDQIEGNTFYLNLQNDAAYIESGGIVEEVRNNQSIGVSFTNLVSNGDFASATTGWSALGGATLSASGSGGIRITNVGTNGSANQTISGLTTGKRYKIKASLVTLGPTTTTCTFTVRIPSSTVIVTQSATVATDFYLTFIAPGDSVEVRLINGVTTASAYSEWDTVEMYEVDAVLSPSTSSRPTKSTSIDGKKYLLLDGTNDFMYGSGNIITHSPGFTKVITFEWDDSVANLVDNHLISSVENNIHMLAIVKTNATTCRIKDGLTTSGQYDLLIDRLHGQRITVIETWGGGTKSIWINGVKQVNEVATSTTVTGFSFLLGSFNNGAASTFFKGKIFEAGIYNVKLSDSDVEKIDRLQQHKFRIPYASNIICAGAGESVEVGYGNAPVSDNIIAGAGLNYLPTLNMFRIANDVNGDSYSTSVQGSKIPPLCDEVFSNTGKQVLYVQTAKSGSTVSSISASGDGLTHWGPDGLLRYNSSDKIKQMLVASGKTLEWLIINIGENDAIYMSSHPEWTKALFKSAYQDIIDYFKEQFTGLKIIIVQSMNQRAYPSDNITYGPQTSLINSAQQELVNENANCFLDSSTSTFTITNGLCLPDGQHYSKLGNEIVGASQGQIIINN